MNIVIVVGVLLVIYLFASRKNIWLSLMPLMLWVAGLIFLLVTGEMSLLNIKDDFMALLGLLVLVGIWAEQREKIKATEAKKMAVKDL